MFKNSSATRASFRGIGRIDRHDHAPSLYRFGCESLTEIAPTTIQNALRQMLVANHILNLQIFNGNHIIGLHQTMRQFVQEVAPLVLCVDVKPLQLQDRFAAILAALLAPSYASLGNPQLGLAGSIPLGVIDLCTVGQGDKTGNANIYPDALACAWQWFGLFDFTGKRDVPVSRLANYARRLNLPFEIAMPTHRHATDTRQFQASPIQAKAVAVLFEAKAIKAVPSFEAWITWLLTSLDAAKEGLKGFV